MTYNFVLIGFRETLASQINKELKRFSNITKIIFTTFKWSSLSGPRNVCQMVLWNFRLEQYFSYFSGGYLNYFYENLSSESVISFSESLTNFILMGVKYMYEKTYLTQENWNKIILFSGILQSQIKFQQHLVSITRLQFDFILRYL